MGSIFLGNRLPHCSQSTSTKCNSHYSGPPDYPYLLPFHPVLHCYAGTSTYGFNPANGRINCHIDTWDSIQNQQYFSFEAFGDFFKQLLQTYTTPALGTPAYTLLR